jgi:hypothetical protein
MSLILPEFNPINQTVIKQGRRTFRHVGLIPALTESVLLRFVIRAHKITVGTGTHVFRLRPVNNTVITHASTGNYDSHALMAHIIFGRRVHMCA